MFLRKFELKIGDDAGDGLDFSSLHVQFSVEKKDSATPNSARITIFNVAQSTVAQVQKEFNTVYLSAGYEDNCAAIFHGTIQKVVFARENGTDGILTIAAGDGDVAHNFAVVNKTLAAGATQKDVVAAASAEYEKNGTTAGFSADFETRALPRGKVMFGMARDFMQSGALNSQTNFSVQDGKTQFVKENGALPDEAYVLNSATGLIGSPMQTTDGVQCTCLLNPRFKIGSVVQIAEKDITESIDSDESSALAADGYYRIYSLNFDGDTHGNDWYCNFVGVALDATTMQTTD